MENVHLQDVAVASQASVADGTTTTSVGPGEEDGSQIQHSPGTMEMNVTVELKMKIEM